MTDLFQLGNFILSSGRLSWFKIDCDYLTREDWSALAKMIREDAGSFSRVYGVPRGGMKLAGFLEQYCVPTQSYTCLVVDDVLTTGGSMERMRQEIRGINAESEIIGAVVFARGPCPPWVRPLFQMPERFWIQGYDGVPQGQS